MSRIMEAVRELRNWMRGRGGYRLHNRDGVWMTYDQAGKELGVSPEAVRQRAIRGTLRRMPGPNGRALVLVQRRKTEVSPLGSEPVNTGATKDA